MWNQELYKRALDFAARAHGDQRVPGNGFPYVVHVAKVAMEVLRASVDGALSADLAMPCALLHDCLGAGSREPTAAPSTRRSTHVTCKARKRACR